MATQPIVLRPTVSFDKKPAQTGNAYYLPGFSTNYARYGLPSSFEDSLQSALHLASIATPSVFNQLDRMTGVGSTSSGSVYSPESTLASDQSPSSFSGVGGSEYTPGSITAGEYWKQSTPEDYGGGYEVQKVMKDAGVPPALFDKVGMAVQQAMRLAGVDPTIANLVPIVSAAASFVSGNQGPGDQAQLGARIQGALASQVSSELDPTGISRAFIPSALTAMNGGNIDSAISNALGTAVGMGANALVPGLGGLGTLAAGLYNNASTGDLTASTINALLGGALSSNPITGTAFSLARNFLGFNPGQAAAESMGLYPDLVSGFEGGAFGRQGRGGGLDADFSPSFTFDPEQGFTAGYPGSSSGLDLNGSSVNYAGTPWGMINPEYSARNDYADAFISPGVGSYSPLSSIYDLTSGFNYDTGYDLGSGMGGISYDTPSYAMSTLLGGSGFDAGGLEGGYYNGIDSQNSHSFVVVPRVDEYVGTAYAAPSYSSSGTIMGGTGIPTVYETTPTAPTYNYTPTQTSNAGASTNYTQVSSTPGGTAYYAPVYGGSTGFSGGAGFGGR